MKLKHKKIWIALMIITACILFQIDAFASNELVRYTTPEIGVIQYYSPSDMDGVVPKPLASPVAILYKPEHPDNVGLFQWVNSVGLQAIYSKPFYSTTVPIKGSKRSYEVQVYLWRDTNNSTVPFENINLANLYYNRDYTTLGNTGLGLVFPYRGSGYYNANFKNPVDGTVGSSNALVKDGRISLSANGIVNNASTRRYEWRYLGVDASGKPISNPGFPVDVPTANYDFWNRNHVRFPWEFYPSIAEHSNFNRSLLEMSPEEQKKTWDIFFKINPGYITVAQSKGYTSGTAWEYWRDYLQFLSNPYTGGSVVLGVHEPQPGVIRYFTHNIPGPTMNDVEISMFEVYDEKGLVDRIRRVDGLFVSQNNSSLVIGKEYTFKTYLQFKPGQYNTRTTTNHNKSVVNAFWAPLNTSIVFNQFTQLDTFFANNHTHLKVLHSNAYPNGLPVNTNVSFESTLVVPVESKDIFTVIAQVPDVYRNSGDNFNQENDIIAWNFQLKQNDLVAIGSIRLFQQGGQEVNSIENNRAYYAEVTMKSDSAVPVLNPIVNFRYDTGSGMTTVAVVANGTLLPGETIFIKTEPIIFPTRSTLKISAVIHPVHKANGVNHITTNDNWGERSFTSVMNFAVTEFKVNSASFNYSASQTFPKQERVSFNAKLINENLENIGRDVNVVIRTSGTVILSRRVFLPANQELDFSWDSNISILGRGSQYYTIEINPSINGNREYIEFNRTGDNPYADNIKGSDVRVFVSDIPAVCNFPVNYDSWTQNFNLYQWRGYWQTRTCSYSYLISSTPVFHPVTGLFLYMDNRYGTTYYDCSGCVTTSSWVEYPSYTHFESYSITNVYFKSKLTEDVYGGWIDALMMPAKIKSGYGFELRVVTRWTTHYPRPYEWSTLCEGASASPGTQYITPTSLVTVTMPYADDRGNLMKFNLNVTSWSNSVQVYELPMRDSFNKKFNERKIYINEDAGVGTYQIRIDTGSFWGSSLNPTMEQYCDRKTITLEIVGSMQDDVKTNILQ